MKLSCATNYRATVELIEIDGPHFLLQTEPAACAKAVERFMRHSKVRLPQR
jgi:surfactin synthase thioesterase subunit